MTSTQLFRSHPFPLEDSPLSTCRFCPLLLDLPSAMAYYHLQTFPLTALLKLPLNLVLALYSLLLPLRRLLFLLYLPTMLSVSRSILLQHHLAPFELLLESLPTLPLVRKESSALTPRYRLYHPRNEYTSLMAPRRNGDQEHHSRLQLQLDLLPSLRTLRANLPTNPTGKTLISLRLAKLLSILRTLPSRSVLHLDATNLPLRQRCELQFILLRLDHLAHPSVQPLDRLLLYHLCNPRHSRRVQKETTMTSQKQFSVLPDSSQLRPLLIETRLTPSAPSIQSPTTSSWVSLRNATESSVTSLASKKTRNFRNEERTTWCSSVDFHTRLERVS